MPRCRRAAASARAAPRRPRGPSRAAAPDGGGPAGPDAGSAGGARRTGGGARTCSRSRRARKPGVVAVLPAPARVAPDRLDVAVRARADPDVGPRRRDRERADSRELARRTDRPSADADVREASTGPAPANARSVRVDVAQPARDGVAPAGRRGQWSERGRAGPPNVRARIRARTLPAGRGRGRAGAIDGLLAGMPGGMTLRADEPWRPRRRP